MDNFGLPLQYAQIHLLEYNGFTFLMPEQDIGRNDIRIFVEYSPTDDDTVLYVSAWAQQKDSYVRWCCYETSFPASRVNEQGIESIVNRLNEAQAFRDGVHRFIEWLDSGNAV